jgi:uncharacterized coiled-coil protein SlyX
MTKLATLALATSLAVTGSALAATEPAPTGGPDPGRIAARCELGYRLLDRLEARAERLAARIAKLEERIAGAELTAEQLARAEKVLARLEERQTKLDEWIDELSGKLAEKCDSAATA